ncbi:MAG: hypothetical protein ACYC6L_01145, partial [Anaerolineae bacterium]
MIPDYALCRFRQSNSIKLGFVKNQQLYDLSSHWASLGDWLVAASGRAQQAISELNDLTGLTALGPAARLLNGAQGTTFLAPLDSQEVWAFGVTYEMSREARMRESNQPTIYGKVYDAPRPEIFFKATPHRVVASGEAV